MQSIGDIMEEMQAAPLSSPASARMAERSQLLINRAKSRLQEYSCSQLSEEDYAEPADAWSEWPYTWVVRAQEIAHERLHSLHQKQNTLNETPLCCETAEYSRVTAKAA